MPQSPAVIKKSEMDSLQEYNTQASNDTGDGVDAPDFPLNDDKAATSSDSIHESGNAPDSQQTTAEVENEQNESSSYPKCSPTAAENNTSSKLEQQLLDPPVVCEMDIPCVASVNDPSLETLNAAEVGPEDSWVIAPEKIIAETFVTTKEVNGELGHCLKTAVNEELLETDPPIEPTANSATWTDAKVDTAVGSSQVCDIWDNDRCNGAGSASREHIPTQNGKSKASHGDNGTVSSPNRLTVKRR